MNWSLPYTSKNKAVTIRALVISLLIVVNFIAFSWPDTLYYAKLFFIVNAASFVVLTHLIRLEGSKLQQLPTVLIRGFCWLYLWHDLFGDGTQKYWLQYVLAGIFTVFETIVAIVCRKRRNRSVIYTPKKMRKIIYHRSAN